MSRILDTRGCPESRFTDAPVGNIGDIHAIIPQLVEKLKDL
jgi:hypothetical protein